jgi:hypothetical protein
MISRPGAFAARMTAEHGSLYSLADTETRVIEHEAMQWASPASLSSQF